MTNPSNRIQHPRILVIDDNRAIHGDFRKILGRPEGAQEEMEAAEARIFGGGESPTTRFEIDVASQGDEGVAKIRQALAENRPYALAFVDVRMPPGRDGIETTRRIWEICPDIQIVVCTAYADCSWEEMQERIQPGDRLLILKKPFDTIEVLQMANALTEKWRLLQQSKHDLDVLDCMVKERTRELEASKAEALEMMEEAVRNREKEARAHEALKREVAERKKLESQLREQASLLDKARDAIMVRTLDGEITYWNKSAERLYGWTVQEALGHSVTALLGHDVNVFAQAQESLLEKGEWTGEVRQFTKDGKELIIEGRWTLVRGDDEQPKAVLAINTDITERRKLELQFLRAQRMESIGTLAGGIAHDLNNVLTPITMAIEYLRMTIKEDKCQDVLDTIARNAKRGAEMISQVLSFARGMEGRRVEVQAGHLLRDIERIAKDTFPKNIRTRRFTGGDLGTLQGDPTQLHQVLLNLCVNARDAMPEGGQITLSATNVIIDEQYAAMNLEAKPGPHILIQVEDTGTGMPQHVIERIFDPFFTTKEIGKGTGLGLSTSLSIIKSHGGFIQVYSEPGSGTVFRVYLPAKTGGTLAEPPQEDAPLPRGNGETVLVVDDEPSVRQVTRQTLEAFGYRVLLAGDGAEAVALYTQHRDEIDIALVDMAMPTMDGTSTMKVLMKLNPSIKIVAASGIATNSSLLKIGDMPIQHFVKKPYTADVLLRMLRDVLVKEA